VLTSGGAVSPSVRAGILTLIAMLAFAANSLLCREALASGNIGPANFTLIRMASGTLVLVLFLFLSTRQSFRRGSWSASMALFGYAAAFSYAYIELSAGTGALLLFGAVQVTMICLGLLAGERLGRWQVFGFVVALAGLAVLLMPSVSSPPFGAAMLMIASGISWGIYSYLGRAAAHPLADTAVNFARTLPLILFLYWWLPDTDSPTQLGVLYAALSGVFASGMGYALWYAVLPVLPATTAATVQLSVPVIAAVGGAVFLAEAITLRLGLASIAVLGGIAVFIVCRRTQTAS